MNMAQFAALLLAPINVRQALRKMTAVTILFAALAFIAVALALHILSDIVDYLLSKLGVDDHESD